MIGGDLKNRITKEDFLVELNGEILSFASKDKSSPDTLDKYQACLIQNREKIIENIQKKLKGILGIADIESNISEYLGIPEELNPNFSFKKLGIYNDEHKFFIFREIKSYVSRKAFFEKHFKNLKIEYNHFVDEVLLNISADEYKCFLKSNVLTAISKLEGNHENISLLMKLSATETWNEILLKIDTIFDGRLYDVIHLGRPSVIKDYIAKFKITNLKDLFIDKIYYKILAFTKPEINAVISLDKQKKDILKKYFGDECEDFLNSFEHNIIGIEKKELLISLLSDSDLLSFIKNKEDILKKINYDINLYKRWQIVIRVNKLFGLPQLNVFTMLNHFASIWGTNDFDDNINVMLNNFNNKNMIKTIQDLIDEINFCKKVGGIDAWIEMRK